MITYEWILAVLGVGLGFAVMMDITAHRIPNWLTFTIASICLLMQVWFGGWSGFLLSAGGVLAGMLCFLPSYIFGAMGAGDVKLMAAVGAALGPWYVLVAVIYTVLAGGVIALVYIGVKGGMGSMVRRYGRMFVHLFHGQLLYLPPAVNEAAATRIPYAMAVACGSAMAVWQVTGQGGLTV